MVPIVTIVLLMQARVYSGGLLEVVRGNFGILNSFSWRDTLFQLLGFAFVIRVCELVLFLAELHFALTFEIWL